MEITHSVSLGSDRREFAHLPLRHRTQVRQVCTERATVQFGIANHTGVRLVQRFQSPSCVQGCHTGCVNA
jgi:hypothetical protein